MLVVFGRVADGEDVVLEVAHKAFTKVLQWAASRLASQSLGRYVGLLVFLDWLLWVPLGEDHPDVTSFGEEVLAAEPDRQLCRGANHFRLWTHRELVHPAALGYHSHASGIRFDL